jgi:hypothetical protein
MNIEIGKQYVIKGHPYEPNNGLIVTVTGYLGVRVPTTTPSRGVSHFRGNRWCIDTSVEDTWIGGKPVGGWINHVNQDYLFPLDNNTGFEAGSWEALKDIFVPSELVTS